MCLVVIDTIYFFVEKLSKLCALAFVNILIGVRSGVSDKAFIKRFRLRWLKYLVFSNASLFLQRSPPIPNVMKSHAILVPDM